jgi:hypothetical protein
MHDAVDQEPSNVCLRVLLLFLVLVAGRHLDDFALGEICDEWGCEVQENLRY